VKVYSTVTKTYSNVNIPANVSTSDLSAAFNQIGFTKVDVYRSGDPQYGSTWIISYI
jgi:hypothetical protein